jgi:hypothetical protein
MDDESHLPIAGESRPPATEGKQSPIGEESRPLAAISDDDLLRHLAEILSQSRRVEKDLVAHIAEVDERRLYAREAFPSMFAYCTEALHLSESEAYLRIAVARASREHPMILPMLGDGRLHLSGIAQLAPYLTRENRDVLLRRATHRSKRQIEELIAEVAPRGDVPALMRRLPERRMPLAAGGLRPERVDVGGAERERESLPELRTPSGMGRTVTPSPVQLAEDLQGPASVPSPPGIAQPLPASLPSGPERAQPLPPPVVQPLAPGRYKVQFTASAGLHQKLERLRALMRSQVPDGDLGAIIEAAVTEKLERLEARRFAATSRPRKSLSDTEISPTSRHIPAPVRRAVRERDGNRCRYVDASGRRCEERDRLEYHHLHPYGLGGDHRPENVRLMCHAHNAHMAGHDYGRQAMAGFKRSDGSFQTTRKTGYVAAASSRTSRSTA